MVSIDLNCDLGESFGSYQMGNDEAILPLITSATIACGFHAGDPSVMRRTVENAIRHNVGIGAHPGLPDLQGFGRREIAISTQEAYDLVIYQIGALQAVAKSLGTTVRHMKAHGALYNMAAKSPDLAEAIVAAAKACDSDLIIVGLAGSAWVDAAKKMDMRIAQEVFADRRYEEDGSLTPRSRMDALIEDQQEAVEHVIRMVRDGMVTTRQGTRRPIQADTICIHGDGTHALEFAQAIRERFLKEGIAIERL